MKISGPGAHSNDVVWRTFYEFGYKPYAVPLIFFASSPEDVNALQEAFTALEKVLPRTSIRFDRRNDRNAELFFFIAATEE